MVKKFLKSKSKRITTKKRYKIERKVREHNRKLKKEAKTRNKHKSNKKKYISVPGDCPFKEKVLNEALALRESISKAKTERRQEIKAIRKANKDKLIEKKREGSLTSSTDKNEPSTNTADGSSSDNVQTDTRKKSSVVTTFEDLMKRAQERGYLFEKIEEHKKKTKGDSSLKAFYKEFQQVIGESDVIIQVLDSRDPMGTRSSDAESAVKQFPNKKLVLVLNKCDLIPVDNLQRWINYLKETEGYAVLPFKANMQQQKDHFGSIGTVNLSNQSSFDTKKSVGASDLLGLLGTWARNEAGGITVGVIGMPNVGKSSLINSLKRSKACNVGAKPGVTRTCQLIHLDSKIKLIDSPGVVFGKDKQSTIDVETILARVPKATIMKQYAIADFKDEDNFLINIARKYGKMKKGGVPNTSAAESKILHDWNTGVIRFFTEPPQSNSSSSSTATSFVNELSTAFSLDSVSKPSVEEEMDEEVSESDEEMELDEEPSPIPMRITRSASKKQASFSVDTENIRKKAELQAKRRGKVGADLNESSASKKILHGLVASKKPAMKKLRKTKKKIGKQATNLATLIDDINL